jgi:hypothetical protein
MMATIQKKQKKLSKLKKGLTRNLTILFDFLEMQTAKDSSLDFTQREQDCTVPEIILREDLRKGTRFC